MIIDNACNSCRKRVEKEKNDLIISQKNIEAKISIRSFNSTVFLGCSAVLLAIFSTVIAIVASLSIQELTVPIFSLIVVFLLIIFYYFLRTKDYEKLIVEKLQIDEKITILNERISK